MSIADNNITHVRTIIAYVISNFITTDKTLKILHSNDLHEDVVVHLRVIAEEKLFSPNFLDILKLTGG